MEMQCPKGDYVAKGDNEEEVKADMERHAKEAHGSSLQDMGSQVMSKVTGMIKR